MRKIFNRWGLMIMLLLFSLWFPFASAGATQGEFRLEDPYPIPGVIGQGAGHTEISVSLILGALLIVVVIFGGVLFRRIRS